MSEMVAGEYSGKLENLLGANREFSLTHTPAHHHHYIVTWTGNSKGLEKLLGDFVCVLVIFPHENFQWDETALFLRCNGSKIKIFYN